MLLWKGFAVGIVLLFLVSIVPFINGESTVRRGEDSFKNLQKDEYQQYRNDWSIHLTNQSKDDESSSPVYRNEELNNDLNIESSSVSGPMDSAWPMQSHDVRHTGRSQYSTENNPGAEIWRVRGVYGGEVESSAVIDNNGIIYFGTMGADSSLYALYSNCTQKWRFHATGLIWGTPAIADDGTLYFTTWGAYHYLYALNSNGTAKWLFAPGDSCTSSPSIGEDGIIYFGSNDHFIYAVNPNGTEKWRYTTGDIVMASPAIDQDGNIYIGSGDHYLYALYPNGTLRWRFTTGGEIKGAASITTDGTIYIPSFDGYLYALYPNGTMKWRVSSGSSIAAAGVALNEDGTIYVGTEQLRAVYPNGTLKWCSNVQGSIYGTVPAVSVDGTIYVSAGGSLVAVNSDGTEKWRKQLTIAQIMSSPCIGLDGRVYVGSEDYGLMAYGYLHAFGLGPFRAEAGGPYKGSALLPTTLTGLAFGGFPPYTYHWDFGDGNTSDELQPTYTYAYRGNYTATFTVTDEQGNQSQDTTQVTIGYPLPKISIVKPQNAVYLFNIKILPWKNPVVFGRITFEVEASQVEIGIDRVEFYYDGTLMHTDEQYPYQWLYTGHAPPIRKIIAIGVYDSAGNLNHTAITINKWF